MGLLSSTYYKSMISKINVDISKYDRDIKALKAVSDNIANQLRDEIQASNTSINELKTDLNNSVRHNVVFDINTNKLDSHKQKTVIADEYIRSADDCVQDEINKLKKARAKAIDERTDYERQLKKALLAEKSS